MPQVDLKGHTIEELALAANVSSEVIIAAIKMRQQQLYKDQKSQVIKAQQQYLLDQQKQHDLLLQQQKFKEQEDTRLDIENTIRTERVTIPSTVITTEKPVSSTPRRIVATRKAVVKKAAEPKKQYAVGGSHKVSSCSYFLSSILTIRI